MRSHSLYVDVLALDKVLCMSWKRYGVPYSATLEFIGRAVVPFADVLPLGLEEFLASKKYVIKHGLSPLARFTLPLSRCTA